MEVASKRNKQKKGEERGKKLEMDNLEALQDTFPKEEGGEKLTQFGMARWKKGEVFLPEFHRYSFRRQRDGK